RSSLEQATISRREGLAQVARDDPVSSGTPDGEFVDSAILDELDARLAQRGVRPDRHAHAP
ncbi:MAG TPA: hypothetical protein VF904_15035, partial [Anaeromyxobacteraceae bacterium]